MTRGPFLESPDDFSYPKRRFMFAVFAFKIKVSLIFRMIQWTYQWARNYTTIQQVSLSRNRPQASPLSAFFFKFVRISARLVKLFLKKYERMVLKENGSLPVALFRNGRMEEMTDNQLFQILSAHFCFLFPTRRSVPYFQLHVLKKRKKERKKRKENWKLSWDLFSFIA